MAKLSILAGTTSKTVKVFVQDNSLTTGAGLTGLVYYTSSLSAYYIREGAASTVAMNLVTATLGTWTSLGFTVVDGTNMPGLYEIGIPNAALVSGAKSVVIYLFGAANMAPVVLEIELTAIDNQNAVSLGLSAVPISTPLKKDIGFNLAFLMRDSSGNAKTGLTVTAQTCLNAAGFNSCTNSVSEIAFGWYYIVLTAADVNAQSVALRFSASGAQDTDLYLPMLS